MSNQSNGTQQEENSSSSGRAPRRRLPRLGVPISVAAALLTYILLPAVDGDALAAGAVGLTHSGRLVAALGVLMGFLWLTEALPVAVTALLPIALVPLLSGGELAIRQVAAPYAHELIFLYMGGFMMALSMQRWGLHRRLALHVVGLVGSRPDRLVLGFMIATAGLSMWISNTATVVMMLPIALSVIELLRGSSVRVDHADEAGAEEGEEPERAPFAFAICLLLGIAYSASIGGMATLIGTPPNLLLAAFLSDTYGLDLSLYAWLPLGMSITLILLPVSWLLLVRVLHPLDRTPSSEGQLLIKNELERLGPFSSPERRVLVIFLTTALLWVFRAKLIVLEIGGLQPLEGLTDPGIAMVASVALFLVPAGGGREGFLLTWRKALELPWGILILFGGGLSLASCIRAGGVDTFIGQAISGLEGVPTLVFVAVVSGVVLMLTEMTSNTATTATFLPIVAAAADGLGIAPATLLVPMTLAASCAFMMPVATPPNAIVFGSGELTIPQMCRAGIWLNLIALAVILVLSQLLPPF